MKIWLLMALITAIAAASKRADLKHQDLRPAEKSAA